MRKLMFALVMMMTGAFAFGAGTPAKAMPAGPVAAMSDVAQPGSGVQKAQYWGGGFCWRHPYHWRCRDRGYRRHYRRDYYRGYRRDYRHGYRHRHYRRDRW
jgi:hypothetical protein